MVARCSKTWSGRLRLRSSWSRYLDPACPETLPRWPFGLARMAVGYFRHIPGSIGDVRKVPKGSRILASLAMESAAQFRKKGL